MHADTLLKERQEEIQGRLETLGTSVLPVEDADSDNVMVQRVADLRAHLEEELKPVEAQGEYIKQVIRKHAVTDPVDQEFIEAMVFSYNLHVATPTKGEPVEAQAEKERFFSQALERLRDRNMNRESELKAERTVAIPVSGDRTATVVVAGNGESGRIRFSPMEDFTNMKIEVGSETVDKILHGKLTAEDYEGIARVLLTAEGKFGQAARAYAEACFRWADAADDQRPAEKLLATRRAAAQDFRRVLGALEVRDQVNGPMSDIAFHAVYYTICKRFPNVAPSEVPQPFSS